MAARNIIYWDRIKTLRDSFAVVVATAGGAGLFPKAPGTMGTLFAMPLALFIREWPDPLKLAIWIGLAILGTWSAKVFDELMQTGDNQCIVIDEVVGLGITSWTLAHVDGGVAWLAAFFLFRLFDVIKIYPVRLVDRWSKNKAKENTPLARWWGGFGVMADDIMAGFQGLVVIVVLQKLHVLPS
jgi:phosphatidylglycerophosphatase A